MLLLTPKHSNSTPPSLWYDQADFDAISANLCLTSWTTFFRYLGDCDAMYVSLIEYISFLIDIFTPLSRPRASSPITARIDCISAKIAENLDNNGRLGRDLARL